MMTYEEAIAQIKLEYCPECELSCESDCCLKMAIEALEKQIKKKPNFIKVMNIKALDEPITTNLWKCPNCGLTYNTKEYHCICGQAIDWSEE